MNRQILKPQVDVPLVVLLDKGPEGKETTNQRGELEYQYTLNNDQAIIWLPAEARAQLMRTGAQAGDQIQIVKSLRGRSAVWSLQVLPDSAEPAPPQPAPTTRMLAPRPSYADRMREAIASPAPPAVRPAPAAEAAATSLEEVMARCLEASARAHWRAWTNATKNGVQIEAPTWEDVRATGTSLFIQVQQNGGGR